MAPIERLKELDKKIFGLTNRELIANISSQEERRHLGLTTESFEFVREVETFIETTLKRLKRISQKLWSIPDLDVHYSLNYRDSRYGRSNAGNSTAQWRSNYQLEDKDAGLCININSLWSRMHKGAFREYSHIAKDPQIGAIRTPSWKHYVEVLLCHEFAHILEKYVKDLSDFPYHEPNKCLGHGKNWQNIYRLLRIKTGHVKTISTNPATLENLVDAALPLCKFCNQPFKAKRSDARTCSAKCKTYLHRQNKRDQTAQEKSSISKY